jgi:transposase
MACESAAARQFGLAAATVRFIDKRVFGALGAESEATSAPADGVDEIYLGKSQKFLTVVSDLETGEPPWFGRERKQETLDEFFSAELSPLRRSPIEAACVDMWEAFTTSILKWAPQCRIVYDKFHVMRHANHAVGEVRGQSSSARVGACADW